MSIGAHIARALFIVLGLAAVISTWFILDTDVSPDLQKTFCGSVTTPDYNADEAASCGPLLQVETGTAETVAVIGLGMFVCAAAVSVGSRHRLTVRSDGHGAPVPTGPPGYPPPPGR